MTNKVNEIEIPPKYKKLIDYYNKRLEIDPDSAIEKTRKKYGKGESRMYELAKLYSQKPTAYKKMVRDGEAMGKLMGDDSIDTEYNEKHGGLIASKDIELAVKSAEKDNIDVMGMFAVFLQMIKHENITELTKENYIKLRQGIPFRKTLKNQVEEKKAKAEIIEAERRIKRAQTDIMEEYPAQYYYKKTREVIEERDNPIEIKFEEVIYNEDYKEMVNDFKKIAFYLQKPNMDRRRGALLIQEFVINWAGFRIPQIEEKRQIKEKKERQLRIEDERRIFDIEIDEKQEIDEYLESLSIEELHKELRT